MMRVLVSESLMERTWKRVIALSMGQFAALQLKYPDVQAELSTFIIASESQYCYVVVAEAFHESGSKFKTIKP